MKSLIASHQKWLEGKEGGERADLSGIELNGLDLSRVDLSLALMRNAVISDTNLSSATLRWADLRDAGLYSVDLRDADLRGANLIGANLTWADLQDADMRGANMRIFRSGHFTAFVDPLFIRISGIIHTADRWIEGVDEPKPIIAFWKSHRDVLMTIHAQLMRGENHVNAL